jgi:two-component system, NarL family, invasion response regulator UvrY
MSLRIMVVDDSQATRRVVSALVGSRWTVCGSAEDGKTAVKKFMELRPDLVLLDLGMPDIDGIEVGRQIHAIDASTPMILFTLSDPWGLEAPARKAGFMRVISKSEPWKLLDTIKEIVERLGSPQDAGSDDGAVQEHPRRDPSVH